MKNIYYLVLAGCCHLAGTALSQAQSPDYSRANYIPSTMGKSIPNDNSYGDRRGRTSLAFTNRDPQTRLLAPVDLIDYFAGTGNGAVDITWRTGYEPDLTRYEIEYSKDNITFQQVGIVTAGMYLNGKAYTFRHAPVNVRDRIFYRLRMVDKSGRYDYTPVISLLVAGTAANSIFPTVVNAGVLSLNLNESFESVQIVDMQGRILQAVNINGRTGRTDITLSNAAKGICIVQVLGSQQNNQPRKHLAQKVFIQ